MVPQLQWSPDRSWLAISDLMREELRELWELMGPPSQSLLLMRPDGSQRTEIPLAHTRGYDRDSLSWTWDPAGKATYALAPDGKLQRYSLAGGSPQLVWDFGKDSSVVEEAGSGQLLHGVVLSVSPNGKWIAAAFTVREQAGEQAYVFSIYAVAADGSRAYLIYRDSYSSGYALDELKLTWSHDGSSLYFVPPWSVAKRAPPRLCRWQAGSPAAAVIPLPAGAAPVRIAALDTGEMLVWSYLIGPLLLDASDHLRPLPHAPAPKTYSLVGLDAEGRAILQRASGKPELAALDLATGKLSVIYP
jgi:hypothetical protein